MLLRARADGSGTTEGGPRADWRAADEHASHSLQLGAVLQPIMDTCEQITQKLDFRVE